MLTSIVCIAIVCVGVKHYYRGSSFRYRSGERLVPIAGYEYAAHSRTLVIAMNRDCHQCRDSEEFYKRLISITRTQRSPVNIIAIFPNSRRDVNEYIASHGIEIQAFSPVDFRELKIRATPTLFLVDSMGRIMRMWIGRQDDSEEEEIIEQLHAAGNVTALHDS